VTAAERSFNMKVHWHNTQTRDRTNAKMTSGKRLQSRSCRSDCSVAA
jgi:hypothetical protein